jgi:hypothetical protein
MGTFDLQAAYMQLQQQVRYTLYVLSFVSCDRIGVVYSTPTATVSSAATATNACKCTRVRVDLRSLTLTPLLVDTATAERGHSRGVVGAAAVAVAATDARTPATSASTCGAWRVGVRASR